MSSRSQRSLDTMGMNIWTKAMQFGHPIGVAGRDVVAYSSEYRTADPSRFGDDSYESQVDVEVALHPATSPDRTHDIVVRHHHRVSELDPVPDHVNRHPSEPVKKKKFSIYAGAKFQCVEYARRYLIMTHSMTFPSIQMAYHIMLAMQEFHVFEFDHTPHGGIESNVRIVPAVKSLNAALDKNELRQLNETLQKRGGGGGDDAWIASHHRPVPGSLVIWGPGGYFRHTGHVAVVVAVDDARVYIGEQNVTDCEWPQKQPYARSFPIHAIAPNGGGPALYGVNETFFNGSLWGWVTPRTLLPGQ